ncbi:MAG TPA: hypothetical protein VG122_01690 [Gemmata sp.]|jgi:hypothetical protein|nr:hypothetical protein [Gemmata sp.]
MFKSVEYSAFEEHPRLLELAKRAVSVLATEVRCWHNQIDVECIVHPDNPTGMEFTVTLNLPTGSGTGSRFFLVSELEDSDRLLGCCHDVWDRALGDYLEKRKSAWEEIIQQPVEV